MKKYILISLSIFIISFSTSITKEKLFLFADIEKCKSCNNPILNALSLYSNYFDSLNIEYELILKCKRKRDLKDYKHYYNLNDSLKIVALNDSIIELYELGNTQEYFIFTKNDTIYFATDKLEPLLYYLSK